MQTKQNQNPAKQNYRGSVAYYVVRPEYKMDLYYTVSPKKHM